MDSVPYDTLDKAIRGAVDYEKELSEYYQLLSKTNWKFTLVDSPSLFDESGYTAFYEPSFDDSAWDEMDEHELSEWCTRLFEEEQDYELPIHLSILSD